jgi:uncharacterized membrane protein YqjE
MRVLKIVFLASIAGLLLGTAIYAVLVIAFIVDSPGLTNRAALTARVVAIFIVSAVAAAYIFRETRRSRMRWSLVTSFALATIVAAGFFALYLYPIWTPRDHSGEIRRLRTIADRVSASSTIDLPRGQAYAIVRHRTSTGERLTIHASDRWVGRIFGVDLSKVDHIAVEMAEGKVRRAWIDYF